MSIKNKTSDFMHVFIYNVNQNIYNDKGMVIIVATTVPTQIRIDRNIKKEASALFANLGMDMSGAINLFLHQCVMRKGIPFAIEMPHYSEHTLQAMAEARRISVDPDVPSYDNMNDLKKDLES